jgi:trk system potassium uptake protein
MMSTPMPALSRQARSVGRRLLSLNPPQALLLSFVTLCLLGTLLLKLPLASYGETTWLQALFTAVSATTVTGLVVVDTGTHFTLFGQMVLLCLMQAGGLGLMTFGVFVIAMTRDRLSLGQMSMLREALNYRSHGDLRSLLQWMIGFTVIMEMLGTLLLAIQWVPEMGLARGLYFSLFHAISAFNNAGFGLLDSSLMRYAGSAWINLVIPFLFITGGLGFIVVAELVRKRRFAHLSLHAKLMIVGTVVINAVATLAILALEYRNPGTLGGMASFGERLWAAWFQAVSPRTAGFNTIDIGAMTAATSLLMMLLMFIGGGSGSTASGIKLSTFIVLLLATRDFLRNREHPTAFGRSIDSGTVLRAMSIAVISMIIVFAALFCLTVTETASFLDLAFESVSAFGTVGLSRGITAQLSGAGQAAIILLMLVGRIGPLTLAFMIASRKRSDIRHPFDTVNLG